LFPVVVEVRFVVPDEQGTTTVKKEYQKKYNIGAAAAVRKRTCRSRSP